MLQLVKGKLPDGYKDGAVERAIQAFIADVDPHGDPVGFHNQTLGSIYAAIYQNSGDFWMGLTPDGEVEGYVVGSVGKEIDNRLTYWLSQAWAAPSVRGTPKVKAWWQQIREQAKAYFCKHIVVVSARGDKAYCRFLGDGWHEYARLLKEDI